MGFKIRWPVRRRSRQRFGAACKKEIATNRRPEIARLLQRHVQRAAITRSERGCARPISIDDLKLICPGVVWCPTVRRNRVCKSVGDAPSGWAIPEIKKGNANRPCSGLGCAVEGQREGDRE